MLEDTPERMSIEISDNILEKHIRIGCQKRCEKNMSENILKNMLEKDVGKYYRRIITKNGSIERSLLNSRQLGTWRLI